MSIPLYALSAAPEARLDLECPPPAPPPLAQWPANITIEAHLQTALPLALVSLPPSPLPAPLDGRAITRPPYPILLLTSPQSSSPQ